MEITNEIKVKVFAQYLGQKLALNNGLGIQLTLTTETLHYLIDLNEEPNKPKLLILKPLSTITDEDACVIVKMRYGINSIDITKEAVISACEGIINLINDGANVQLSICQYLQSKGYDLPQYLLGGKTLKEVGLAIYE